MRRILSITIGAGLILGLAVTADAQPPDLLWSQIHSISPSGDIDEGKCVRQTMDNGYIITGSCVPNGLVNHIDLLLLKCDPSGDIQWTKTYERLYIEEGLSVEQTSDGGYVIGGRAISGHDPHEYQCDVWLLRADINGDTLWTKTYGGEGNEYCTSILQTSDQGYILTGTMNSEYLYPNYEITTGYDPGIASVWLLKTDSDGDTLWTRTYMERSHGNCVVQTSDGGYIIAGWVSPDEGNNQCDVLLIKTNSSGDTLWTQCIGGAGYEIGLCVRETQDGYVTVGQTTPNGILYDAILIKTDLLGNVQWTETIGGGLNDSGFSVEETADGGFFVTGTTNGYWWIHMGDMWVFKTDSEGNLLWQNSYDLAANDFAWCGIQASDGGYVMTGFVGYGFGGDLWLAKIGPDPTGIKESAPIPIGCTFCRNYPNPFNPVTTFKIELPVASWVTLEIFDVSGKSLGFLVDGWRSAGYHEVTFDAAGLASGVYVYRLMANDFTASGKMVLMK